MTMYCKPCISDEDLANVSRFILNNKRSLHPSFTTLDTVALLYSYITNGHLIQVVDDNHGVIGAMAYYIGTPEEDFKDKEVVFADIAIADRSYRGSRLFIRGLKYFLNQILTDHPEVQEFRLAALSENEYICKLYAKFSNITHKREGSIGEETVFSAKIREIRSFIRKFVNV